MSLKHAILGFLAIQPFSGYDLKKAFDASIQHFWPANQSQIYRTLHQIEADGLATLEIVPGEAQDHLDRKLYHLTETGLAELHHWLRTPRPLTDTREPLLMQVYFAGLITDAEILAVLRDHLAQTEALLAHYAMIHTGVKTGSASQFEPRLVFYTMLTLEYGLRAALAQRDWLQSAIDRITRADYTPLDPATLHPPVHHPLPGG